MIKVNIKVLIVVLIMILLVTIIILQFVAISKIKKKIVSDESKKNDILNLMMMNVMNNMNNNTPKNNINTSTPANTIPVAEAACDMESPQTTFFAKSIAHAEKVLMGKVYLDGYKYGGSMDLTRLDDGTKKSIIIAMKYMMIDPIGARSAEQRMRSIAEQENVPLWFVILHEGIKKLIPIESNPSITQLSDLALIAELERRKPKEKKQESGNGGKIVSITNVA